ncbi:MAG: hypothetical protein ACRENU_04700, partial [Gemmatimonadaceae bacterium]
NEKNDDSDLQIPRFARDDIFSEDADMVPQPDAAFDAWVTNQAPALNEPNAAPREDMWNAIQAARATARDAQAGRIAGVTPLHRRPWFLVSAAAAVLLLGIGVDRLLLQRQTTQAPVAVAPATPADTNDPSRLYRLAAEQTLAQAEALLTAYRSSEPQRNPADARQLGRWGRDVLTSTRLLIDSPAGEDPQLRLLLSDLELVLVQIIQLSGAPLEADERALIDRALEERDLLPRIRTAVPPGPAASASSD